MPRAEGSALRPTTTITDTTSAGLTRFMISLHSVARRLLRHPFRGKSVHLSLPLAITVQGQGRHSRLDGSAFIREGWSTVSARRNPCPSPRGASRAFNLNLPPSEELIIPSPGSRPSQPSANPLCVQRSASPTAQDNATGDARSVTNIRPCRTRCISCPSSKKKIRSRDLVRGKLKIH